MNYLVDLHIHTLLSPCGSLEMSPERIVTEACRRGLDAVAITDHNQTRQIAAVERAGAKAGLRVFAGVEITTREEAHCIALFRSVEVALQMQQFIDRYIVRTPNDPERLGDQIWVDDNEMIEGEVDWYLNMPVDRSVEQVAEQVKCLGGLFVPAHIERPSFSLVGQLGFIAPNIAVDAVEFNNRDRFESLLAANRYLSRYTAYTASDAHFPHLIGSKQSVLSAESRSFDELAMAMHQQHGRKIQQLQ